MVVSTGCTKDDSYVAAGDYELYVQEESSAGSEVSSSSGGENTESSSGDHSTASGAQGDSTGNTEEGTGSDTATDAARPKRPGHTAIRIDTENQKILFAQDYKVQQTVSYTTRDKRDWATGCPRLMAPNHVEVVDLQAEFISFAGVTIQAPVLIAGCPPELAGTVTLRSRNTTAALSDACQEGEACLNFYGVPYGRFW